MLLDGQELTCYGSGDGALHFNWSGLEHPYPSTGRQVKRWHVLRFLRTNEGKRLTNEGWKLYRINTFWQLVRTVVRKDKNTLCMGGHTYAYTVRRKSPRERNQIWDCDFRVYTDPGKALRFAYGDKMEVKNWSTRATLLFFLNHEEELGRADDKGICSL